MPEIAGDEPLSVHELARYQRDHRAWVAVDDAGVPVAYLIADIVDGAMHIEQVSVHPRAARRKIGRMLFDHAATDAAAKGPARPHPDHLRRRAVERSVLCALRFPRPRRHRTLPWHAGHPGP